jgi:hypothetical protein
VEKIVIVNEGQWGEVKRSEYDEIANRLQISLERAINALNERRVEMKLDKEFIEVIVVKNSAVTTELFSALNCTGMIIFLTRGMQYKAQEFANKFGKRGIKVLCYTGLIPEDAVIYIGKGWDRGGFSEGEFMLEIM